MFYTIPNLGVAQDAVVLDLLLVAVVGNVCTVQLGAALSGVGGIMVGCLDDVERGTVVFTTTLNGPAALEGVLVEPAGDVNPSNGVTVTDEDLVGVEMNFVVLVTDHGTFLKDLGSLSELDTTILEGTAGVENSTSLLTDGDSVAGHVLALVENPSDTTLVSAAVILISANLGIPEPVLETPSEGFFLLLTLVMRFPGHVTTSKETGACEKAASNLELLLALVVDIVPVLLLFLMRNVDLLIGMRLVTALLWLLVALLLAIVLLWRLLLLLLATAIASLLLTVVLLLAASVLHFAPQGWSNGRAPIALRAMRLDDFILVSFILHNIVVVVLSTWFPAVDHIDLFRVGCMR